MSAPRLLLAASLLLGACAGGGRRPAGPPVKTAATAVRDEKGRGAEFSRAFARTLGRRGVRAASVEDSDSIGASAALGAGSLRDHRVLAEIRAATGADALLLVTLEPEGRAAELAGVDLRSGEPLLRKTLKARGSAWRDQSEFAETAAKAVAPLFAVRDPVRATTADEPISDIPVP